MSLRIKLILFGLLSAMASVSGQSIVLGVLEELPGSVEGEANSRGVRVVFQKQETAWQALPDNCPDPGCLRTRSSEFPARVNWTIAFDGRKLGDVTARTPDEFKTYSNVGVQEIVSRGPVPTVGKRSTVYGGFAGVPLYRPLIANSQPFFKDPETWKPAALPAELRALLRQHFRKQFPTVLNCANPLENEAKPWVYQDKNLRIVKAYSSRNHWFVAQIQLEGYRCVVFPRFPGQFS